MESVSVIAPNDANAWIEAVNRGPVITYIDGGSDYLLGYTDGILNNSSCATVLNHIVTIVGWGITDAGTERESYWIIRNTWGEEWGESGYARIMIQKNHYGVCGN